MKKSLESHDFKILAMEDTCRRITLNENTWKVIFGDSNIQQMEFGSAYKSLRKADKQKKNSDYVFHLLYAI